MLEAKYESSVNQPGIDRSVERAQKLRASADSARAANQPKSPMPLPGMRGTAGRRAAAVARAAAAATKSNTAATDTAKPGTEKPNAQGPRSSGPGRTLALDRGYPVVCETDSSPVIQLSTFAVARSHWRRSSRRLTAPVVRARDDRRGRRRSAITRFELQEQVLGKIQRRR